MQAYKLDEVFASILAWPSTLENLKMLVDHVDSKRADERSTSYILLGHSPDGIKLVQLLTVFVGPEEEGEAFLAPLKKNNPILIVPGVKMPFTSVQQITKPLMGAAFWYLTGGIVGTMSVPKGFQEKAIEEFSKVPNHFMGSIVLEERGGKAARLDATTSCGISHRDHGWDFVVLFGTMDENKLESLTEVTKRVRDSLRTETEVKLGFGALNTNHTFDLPAELIFGHNYPKLKALKDKYDPQNFFKGLTDLYQK